MTVAELETRLHAHSCLDFGGLSPGTRIPVWTLEGYRRLGWSEAEILENFPTLRASDLAQAWAYVSAHRSEIDQAILANEEA